MDRLLNICKEKCTNSAYIKINQDITAELFYGSQIEFRMTQENAKMTMEIGNALFEKYRTQLNHLKEEYSIFFAIYPENSVCRERIYYKHYDDVIES